MNDIINNISSSLENIELNSKIFSTSIKQNNEQLKELLSHTTVNDNNSFNRNKFTVTTNQHNNKYDNNNKYNNNNKYDNILNIYSNKNEFARDLRNTMDIPKKINTDTKIITWIKKEITLKNEIEEQKSMGKEDKFVYILQNIEINYELELHKLDCIKKFNNCDTLIKNINKHNNINVSITLLRFYNYINFGEKEFIKLINAELKRKKNKILKKRENEHENDILQMNELKIKIENKNDRKNRMIKRRKQNI